MLRVLGILGLLAIGGCADGDVGRARDAGDRADGDDADRLVDALALDAGDTGTITPLDAWMEATDAGLDAAAIDGGAPDAGPPDMPDAGPPDMPDAGMPDAGMPDTGMPDAGMPDAGPPDMPDAGMPDAGMPDAGMPDAGVCVPRTEFCGLPADEDCDGRVDEGCGPCAVGTTVCSRGCCPAAETWLSSNGADPDIDVDDVGNVFVLYSVPRSTFWETRLARYDAATSTWSDREMGTDEGTSRSVLRLDDAGGVHIVAGRDGRALRYYYSSNRGVSFRTPYQLTTLLAIGGTMDMVVAGGVAHVVYMNQPGSTGLHDRLVYAKGGFDGGFAQSDVDTRTRSHRHPRVGVGADSHPWLLYEAYSGTPAVTTLRVAHHDGAAWSFVDIETDAVGIGRDYFNHHQLDVGEHDDIRVLYSRGTIRELVLAERSTAGTWSSRVLDADITASFDEEEDELVLASVGVLSYAYVGGSLRSLAHPANLGFSVALRRVGDELYVAYESSVIDDNLMFARIPLP